MGWLTGPYPLQDIRSIDPLPAHHRAAHTPHGLPIPSHGLWLTDTDIFPITLVGSTPPVGPHGTGTPTRWRWRFPHLVVVVTLHTTHATHVHLMPGAPFPTRAPDISASSGPRFRHAHAHPPPPAGSPRTRVPRTFDYPDYPRFAPPLGLPRHLHIAAPHLWTFITRIYPPPRATHHAALLPPPAHFSDLA